MDLGDRKAIVPLVAWELRPSLSKFAPDRKYGGSLHKTLLGSVEQKNCGSRHLKPFST